MMKGFTVVGAWKVLLVPMSLAITLSRCMMKKGLNVMYVEKHAIQKVICARIGPLNVLYKHTVSFMK